MIISLPLLFSAFGIGCSSLLCFVAVVFVVLDRSGLGTLLFEFSFCWQFLLCVCLLFLCVLFVFVVSCQFSVVCVGCVCVCGFLFLEFVLSLFGGVFVCSCFVCVLFAVVLVVFVDLGCYCWRVFALLRSIDTCL